MTETRRQKPLLTVLGGTNRFAVACSTPNGRMKSREVGNSFPRDVLPFVHLG